jgi:hypothetical protein
MRAFAMLKRPLVSIPALAGLGLVAGLAFAADRLAARDTPDITASCTKLNVGKGDGCGRAYLTKEQFDEIFAQLEAASKLNARDAAVFGEKLRLVGTKRLVPSQPMDKYMVVRTRLASLDPATALLEVDTTLRTSFLGQATIFGLLMEDPKASPPDTRVSQSDTATNNGG